MNTIAVILEHFKARQLLSESIHDKTNFKAVFLGGGPASGKDYILNKVLEGQGLKEINVDVATEFLMKKNGLSLLMPKHEEPQRNIVRGRAKQIRNFQRDFSFDNKTGVIINGTGDDFEEYKKMKEKLESMGYETSMVFVVTSNEVSKQRNIERGQRGGRTVDEDIRSEKWKESIKNKEKYAKLFGDNYIAIDNTDDTRKVSSERKKQIEQEHLNAFKKIKKFVEKPVENDVAKEWYQQKSNEKGIENPISKNKKVPNIYRGIIKKAFSVKPNSIKKPANINMPRNLNYSSLSNYSLAQYARFGDQRAKEVLIQREKQQNQMKE